MLQQNWKQQEYNTESSTGGRTLWERPNLVHAHDVNEDVRTVRSPSVRFVGRAVYQWHFVHSVDSKHYSVFLVQSFAFIFFLSLMTFPFYHRATKYCRNVNIIERKCLWDPQIHFINFIQRIIIRAKEKKSANCLAARHRKLSKKWIRSRDRSGMNGKNGRQKENGADRKEALSNFNCFHKTGENAEFSRIRIFLAVQTNHQTAKKTCKFEHPCSFAFICVVPTSKYVHTWQIKANQRRSPVW
jgi:hypothetical protein